MSTEEADRLVLLGSKGGPALRPGGPWPSSSLLELGGRNIVVDSGLGVTRGLVDAGISLKALDLIFITHLHSDHVLELGPLTGLLTAGTMAVMGAADRSAMEKKNSATALPVRAGQTYFLELEPLPREAAAVYQLSLLDLAEAEQRLAQCSLGKAAAAKAPPAPAKT